VTDEQRAARALDEACALALGWKRMHGNLTEWYAPDGTYLRQDFDFRPSEWGDDARLLEDEIERRGLQHEYIIALFLQAMPEAAKWGITDKRSPSAWVDRAVLFALLRATPEQRARAFLEAVKDA